jgi:hypothetical protein
MATIAAPIVQTQASAIPLATFAGSAAITSLTAPFEFKHVDPAALLSDAIALFTHDSLATTSSTGAFSGAWSTKPWAATAFVIAADAALVGYYIARRSGKKRPAQAPAGSLVILGEATSEDDATRFSLVPLTPGHTK